MEQSGLSQYDLQGPEGPLQCVRIIQDAVATQDQQVIRSAYDQLRLAVSQAPGSMAGYQILIQLAAAFGDAETLIWAASLAHQHQICAEDLYLSLANALANLNQRAAARNALTLGMGIVGKQPRLLHCLGVLCAAEGSYVESALFLRESLRGDESNAETWLDIAQVELALQKQDVALDALYRVSKLNPHNPRLLPLSEELVRRCPNSRDGWFCVGVGFMYTSSERTHDYESAERALLRSLEIGPPTEELLLQIGHLYGFQSRWEKVMPYYIRANEMSSDRTKELGLDKLGLRFLGRHFSCNIGHQTLIDVVLKMEIMGWLPPARTLIYPAEPAANPHLLKYFEPYAHVLGPQERTIFAPMLPYLEQDFYCFKLADGRYFHHIDLYGMVQKQWEEEARPPLLALTNEDRERGWNLLSRFGLTRGARFVVLHVRETALGPDGEWLPCGENRNAHIETYSAAVDQIIESGAWVIRIGNPSMKKLSPRRGFIDFAHSEQRADWLDIFLLAECDFFLGSPSGPCYVPNMFGKPAVHGNHHTLERLPPPEKDLFTPKLVWFETEKRLLTFAEMRTDWRPRYTEVSILKQANLRLVDNTAEEITELTCEMLRRRRGEEYDSEEDEDLQREFRLSISADDSTGRPRIGKAFLRRYRHLLGPIPKGSPFRVR